MKYKIVILKRAMKFIAKQPFKLQNKILQSIYNLPNGDIKLMKGHHELFRLRIDDVRVLYTIDNSTITIKVIDAGNRGQIYKRY